MERRKNTNTGSDPGFKVYFLMTEHTDATNQSTHVELVAHVGKRLEPNLEPSCGCLWCSISF